MLGAGHHLRLRHTLGEGKHDRRRGVHGDHGQQGDGEASCGAGTRPPRPDRRLPVHRLFLLFPRSRLCSVGMEKTRHRQTRAAENPHQSAATGQARERHTDGFSDRYLFLLVPRNLLFERRLPIC